MIKVIDKTTLDYQSDRFAMTDIRINQYSDIHLTVTETEDTITFKADFTSATVMINDYSLEKTFNKDEYKNTICDITFMKRKLENPYELMLLTRKANRLSAPMSSPTTSRLCPYATVFITDDIVYIVPRVRLTLNSNKFDNSEYTSIDFGEKTTQQVLFEYVPEAKTVQDKFFIKKEALGDSIDPYSSISYLENQVDVLYKIIDKLIDKTGIDVSEYSGILSEVAVNSSLNINSLEKTESKIHKGKSYIRKRQEAYYRMLREAGFDA